MFDVCNICNLLQARLSEPGLTYLLTLLSRIPEILGEGVMFGSGVVPRGVFSCLQAGGGRVVTEEVGTVILGHAILYLIELETNIREVSQSRRKPRQYLFSIES